MGLTEWPPGWEDDLDDQNEEIEVEVELVVAETEKALLLKVDGEDSWVPRSVIGRDSDELEKGDSGMVFVPQWFIESNGLDW